MNRKFARFVVMCAWALVYPSMVFAQASITGVVRDTSQAVLPGVTVEASSPALIEKVRSVVTDATGQYRIIDLRPGTYTVTFTLPGFSTVKREGIELTGSFTATVNAELRVGALEETITVTGETPIVDVQSATKQRVVDSEIIAAVPTGRVYAVLTQLVPGVHTVAGNQDVGGNTGGLMTDMLVHGSKLDAQRIMENGLSLAVNIGFKAPAPPNVGAYQEVTIETGGVDASTTTGGVRINFIPREGGNTFRGNNFFSFGNDAMQGSNFDQRLRDRGLATPDSVKRLWDINPAFGGPIKQDRLWFFTSMRQLGTYNYVGGIFYNANAHNPNAWTYVPDRSRPGVRQEIYLDAQARLTWQATPRNKFSVVYNHSDTNENAPFGCECIRVNRGFAPEAAAAFRFPLERRVQADWASPLTDRILLEAVALRHDEQWSTDDKGFGLVPPGSPLISVTEQGGPIAGLTFRAPAQYGSHRMRVLLYRASLSYITGAHAFKVGVNNGTGGNDIHTQVHVPYSYRFRNGVPNLIFLRAAPTLILTKYNYDFGLYAQDKWTRNRLTLNYGVRFDAFGNTIPAQHLGQVALAPTRDLSFPKQPNLAFRDLTPKTSAVYDLFGNGRTAVKASLNKYLQGLVAVNRGLLVDPARVNNVVHATARAWNDSNRDYVPDCDLINPQANGECGRMANTAFGTLGPVSTWDPDLLTGWGNRHYNWEFSTGVQHQLGPRVSVEVSYFRRWYGNFQVVDDLAVDASDFDTFSITAPSDPRLPNGGGHVVSGLYDLKPEKFGVPSQFHNTLDKKFGKQIERWNGAEFTVNARLRNGLTLQGGLSTGRRTADNCEIVAKLPELLVIGSTATPQAYCHIQEPFTTQAKFLGAYTIPKIDVLVSGTLQSLPGPQVGAFFVATNAVVAPSLGRNLSGGNQNVTVNLIRQSTNLTPYGVVPQTAGTVFGDRMNQVDLRVGKVLRLGRTRATASFDLYNATNSNAVLIENSNYASFRQPFAILSARLAKVSVQFDF